MKVSIRNCGSYDPADIAQAVKEGVSYAFGTSLPFRKGQRVLLKVNLLSDKEPEKAVTTHPAVVEAVILLVKKAGAVPVVGDRPFPFIPFSRVARKTGMADLCKKHGVELLALDGPTEIPFHEGYAVKGFRLTRHLERFDAIIDIPKLKTHSFMVYTGAIKNLFGLVSGKGKPALHLRFNREDHFGLMLLDLYRLMRPKVVMTVMDAVIGMEGSGPLNGTPRQAGYILVGDDCLAVDTVASKMAGLRVPYLGAAARKGLLGSRPEDIALDRDLREVTMRPFTPPKKGYDISSFAWLRNSLVPYPVVSHKDCIHCKRCFHSCPAKAIDFRKGIPVFDYRKCIRCYCCQEMCPAHAIRLKRTLLSKIIPGTKGVKK